MTASPLYRLAPCEPDDAELLRFSDHTLFQTRAWLEFVKHTQHGEIVTADLLAGARKVGRFSGVIVRGLGLRILGSPLPGWTTAYQGFNLEPGVSRADAYRALREYAFDELGCMHVEVTDRHALPADFEAAGFLLDPVGMRGFEVDLEPDLVDIFGAMKPACRRNVRKAERVGVTVEIATDAGFAAEYYAQLQDVFAKQRLVPTYDVDRVRVLIERLAPTSRLLLLRARDPDGVSIATGIFPAANDTMYFWGGASWRAQQILRPNEAITWAAIRHWKERGITSYDMMGGGNYKKNYGAKPLWVPRARISRYAWLERLRNGRKRAQDIAQRVSGTFRS